MDEMLASDRFWDYAADLTVESSDGVLFKVFSKDLVAYTGAFPSTEVLKTNNDEVVPLSETSNVLDLLFQYTRRQRQPDLSNVSFKTLAPLAEAVEKYEVFSATEICKAHMLSAISEHPIEVLAYATRHGYDDLRDKAAPKTLDVPYEQAKKLLNTDVLLAWVAYRERWLKALFNAHKGIPAMLHAKGRTDCGKWQAFRADVLTKLDHVGALQDIEKLFESSQAETHITPTECFYCAKSASDWLKRIKQETENTPPFNSFIGLY